MIPKVIDSVFWLKVTASLFGILASVLCLMWSREKELKVLSIVLLITSVYILIEEI